MAEYILGFNAETGAAIRNIDGLKKEIARVTKEFNNAEAGSSEFIQSASDLSQLTLGLKTARGAVVDIDKAYRDLNKAVEANFAVHTKATSAATKYHKDVLQLAQESAKEQDRLRNKQFKADVEAFDMKLKIATVASKKIAAQQKAIMEFRAGMAARGAIPAIASPIRGGINFPDSPDYKKAIADAAAKAAREARASGGVTIPAELKFQPYSLAYYESKLKALSAQARLIAPNSEKWKSLNKQILEAERGIAKIQKRQRLGPTMGQRASAAGGAFLYGGGLGGGVGSALGGIGGGLLGGVPGAFAGAAIGQAVDNLGTALAGITSQASQVQQLQRGLALASIDAKDFAQAQAAVADTSARLFIPLEQVTKSFSQLRVNTKQYGLSVEETKQILEGTILAVSAFGGSADDVDGAMRAVVQILSKGSVQAEELRGQLGERFPGAVIKFAQANKLSFDELQNRLKEGTIGIKEFVTFAEKNYEDYAAFSEKLATAPEFAGRRLQIALEQISLEVGGLFGPMGAEIQDGFTQALKGIKQFISENRTVLRQMIQDFKSIVVPIAKVFGELLKILGAFAFEIAKVFTSLFQTIKNAIGLASIGSAKARLDKAKAATAGKTRTTPAQGDSIVDVVMGKTVLRDVKDLLGIQNEFEELDAAQKQFNALGGMAAYKQASQQVAAPDLVFGGPGAGMDMSGLGEDATKTNQQSLESFERLRDQLANAYNQAEIERIKARYELEKQLQDNLKDTKELGANRLQRQNLQFIRNLQNAEQKRVDAMMDAQLDLMQARGRVDGGAVAGGSAGVAVGSGFSTAQLQKASQEAARFTGVANMCSESVKAFYKSLGISLPGVTAWADTVRKAGQTMTDWSKLQAGDIVATGRPGDTPHVGVYTGGNNVFHQSRQRGLRAGNYPDLNYFKSGYFVRPNAMSAGAPRQVGSNENRDILAAANTEIKQANILLTEKNSLLLKESDIMKAIASYVNEAFGIPDLELDNKMLQKRNDLIAQGLDEDAINYRMKFIELESRHSDLIERFSEELKGYNFTEDQRKKILDTVTQSLNRATEAEKEKNDETLRGIRLQEQMAMTRSIGMASPLGGMGLSAGFIGAAGSQYEDVFSREVARGSTEENARLMAEQFAQLQTQLSLLETRNEAIKSSILSIGDAFATAMTTGVASLITGTASAKEVFASFLESVGQSLMQAAQQMIAQYIAVGIARIFAGLGGGLGGGAGLNAASALGSNPNVAAYAPLMPFANGGIARGGFRAFANGGTVTGPTLGLVGEGRYNEAIVPLPDGRSIPVQMRGNQQSSRDLLANQRQQQASMPSISMSFQTSTINGVEYVSRDQLEQAMAATRRQAAADGASRGMTMTLDKLQQSPSTRSRLGIGGR